MKKIRSFILIILMMCYLVAIIIKSDFWGNLLSPSVSFFAFIVVFHSFSYKSKNKMSKIIGLLLSLGLLSWVVADILWAVYDMVLMIDPQEVGAITFLYALTNVFITLSITVYGYYVFRKWNIVQIFLDSLVITFFVVDLIWVVFLDQNIANIILLKSDWISTLCIILDLMIVIWVVIWYMSVRNGLIPLYLRYLTAGVLTYAITDLIYYYQYFFSKYDPNSYIDVIYVVAFLLIAIAAEIHINLKDKREQNTLLNTGNRRKSYALILAPILLFLFDGFDVTHLLHYFLIVLTHQMLSNYIQKNIVKESLLRKEQKYTNELEQKVKARTEELEEKNKILQHLLDQDFVTGLKNRRYLMSYLDQMIASLKQGETIVLLYIDINRFKMISTMYGQYIGDMILYEMAEKLIPLERSADHTVLTSYGDDTFIFAAVGHYDYEKGYKFALRAIQLCSDIYQIEDYRIRVTVNIGISIYPNDSANKEELIRHADIAMSQARHQGFNVVHEFDAELSKKFFRRNMIEIMLKKVNFNQEFMIYYQPQFQAHDKKLVGFEALLRWKTQNGEMIGPGEFIPVAEETGSIIPIGHWVMMGAMKQLVDWNKRFNEKIMIGINVSLKQLNSIKFIDDLQKEMKLLEIEPEWVDLEITESLQLHENQDVLKILEDIRRIGVRISIDDFGTGYSSLSYFKKLPADRIKLAKELVDYIHIDELDYKLVEAIILLSKAKGIKVIAEGVETREQWQLLKELQCDEVQGYYFGKPAPVEVIEATYQSIMKTDITV